MRGRFDDLITDGISIRKYLKLDSDVRTLAGNITVLDGSPPLLQYDAGGSSRNVTFPTRALTNDGQMWLVSNISTAGENLVLKDAAAATILTLSAGGLALVIAQGTSEAPGTRGWVAVPIGGEDLALADDLAITGDLSVAGAVSLGNNTADNIALWGVTGTTQPTSANEAAVPTTAFVLATGTITSSTPYGLSVTAAVQALIDLANSAAARATALTTLTNQLRADLVSVGIIKGS